MEISGKKVLLCSCEGTMALDAKSLAKALGVDGEPRINSQLCRAEIENFRSAAGDGAPLLVACTQEAPLFAETLDDAGTANPVGFTNIRERAGWSEAGERALPKVAALLAEAALDIPGTGSVTLSSEGRVLVYGRDERAIEAARQLAGRMDPIVVLREADGLLPPRLTEVLIFRGTIASARGHLGAFEVIADGHAPARPASRRVLEFAPPRDGVQLDCDVILDLCGDAPLFPAAEKRDGYFRPDPGNPALVQKALFDITDLVGEFEKPLYVTYDGSICAHSRSGKVGCTKCLDVCPASAIQSDGDTVAIDPFVCAGCGGCASVCPTGAASYAMPPRETVFQRLRTLLATYVKAGGAEPVLLLHDSRFGEETIDAIGRYGRGLPANVLPFAVNQVTQIGVDFLAVAMAYGAARVLAAVGPEKRDELDGLNAQVELADAVLGGLGYGAGRVEVVAEEDPLALEARLWGLEAARPIPAAGFLTMGGKRSGLMLALRHLAANAPEPKEILPLPAGAPFGRVEVRVEGCTLCLACVGACPTGALIDNPDMPMLRFNEEACIQCGLCRATCPESVIALEPRLNFGDDARTPVVVKQEEPFNCVRCGKPFGTKGTIERMVERLAGHAMFADADKLERIKMCDDCRVIAVFEEDAPLAGGARPLTRTTEDYYRERDGQGDGDDDD